MYRTATRESVTSSTNGASHGSRGETGTDRQTYRQTRMIQGERDVCRLQLTDRAATSDTQTEHLLSGVPVPDLTDTYVLRRSDFCYFDTCVFHEMLS